MKQCTKCKTIKSLDDFHNCKSKKSGKMSHCKSCRNSYNNKKAAEIGYDVLYKRALERDPEYREKSKKYYQENKQAAIERAAKWRRDNPGCRQKEYQNAKQKKIEYAAKWASDNPEKRRSISRRYSRKFNANPDNKPYILCRKLLARIILITGRKKKTKTELELGYSKDELRANMESKFTEGMSWKNHGEWHIDHIKPVSVFISEGETDPKVINALDNLQPLWAKDNLSKGAKYDAE